MRYVLYSPPGEIEKYNELKERYDNEHGSVEG